MGLELLDIFSGDGQRVNIPNSIRNEKGDINTRAGGIKNEKKMLGLTVPVNLNT